MFWEPYIKTASLKGIAISIAILLLFFILRKVFSKIVLTVMTKVSRKSSRNYMTKLFLAFEKPVQWFFVIIGISIAARYFPYVSHTNELLVQILRAWIVILIGKGLYNLTSSTSVLFTTLNKKGKLKIDKILIPFISQGLRFFIIAITFSVAVSVFGYNISTFVAGLGIGGLAFALAAQDALSNLFGGFVILTEKPFTVGDWIETPSVEGTVEDITFRSTRVRTFGDALVTIPNATLANQAITNWSKMGKRKVTFNVRVPLETPIAQLKILVDQVDRSVRQHPEIHSNPVYVAYNEYNELGVDILVEYFTKTTVYAEYLKVKEEMNFAILDIVNTEVTEE